MRKFLIVITAMTLVACMHEEYDTTRGIDTEVTLFTDEVSLPVGDVGPVSMGILLDKSGFRNTIKELIGEDDDGYLMAEASGEVFSNFVMLLSMMSTNPSQPLSVPIADFSGSLDSKTESLSGMGFDLPLQRLSLSLNNPLTEEIKVSGKLSVSSAAQGDAPAQTILSEEFSGKAVPASSPQTEILTAERSGSKVFSSFVLKDMVLQLPADLLSKDPYGGFGAIQLKYNYRTYVSFRDGISISLGYDIKDLDLPLGQFKVKEARICTEVSSEIPVTLVIDEAQALVKQTDEEGNESIVPAEDISITPGLTIASGTSGNPVETPLEIVVTAGDGTIPDLCGISVKFSIKSPTGDGDKRIGMNQNLYLNNIRAVVSGGITIPSSL